MSIDITVKIGGEAGQGIQTVAELLSLVCRKAGLYIMTINDFESRIRGGHSFLQMRICDHPVYAPFHRIHLLVSLDRKTYDLHRTELVSGGLTLIEAKEGEDASDVLAVPFIDLAKEAGGKITANSVAAGACLTLLGAPPELLEAVLTDHFSQKGQKAIDMNVQAARAGYEAAKSVPFPFAFEWKPGKIKGVLLDGSRAVALGALAADCRFAAFYPMSPATGVMAQLSALSDQFPLVVEQVEDEIAAVNMIVGASFAGARAITSTSGGGFCLMTEGLGLAAITETPIVIVNAQRPGPATGLPTRTAQGDLRFAIHASQDEFPRFVFAPATPEEAYEVTQKAFYLSEKYQVPAIILTDQYLADSIFVTENPLTAPTSVERFIATDSDIENPEAYQRYAVTADGISPRVLPCSGKSLLIGCGNEHREDGHTSEASEDRIRMVNKRNAKIPNMTAELSAPKAYHGDAEILLVGWGSTEGAIKEAVVLLREAGTDVGCLTFTDIWPFPADRVTRALKNAKAFYVVEGNSMSQFGLLIREQTGLMFSAPVLKYDGRPFFPIEIVEAIQAYTR